MTPELLRLDLARLRAADAGRFPAAHRWRLNPPLPESAALEFEARHGVALPGGYREFLTRFGDGGAGPAYGLFTLADAEARLTARGQRPASLAAPFPAPATLDEARRLPEPVDGMLPIAEIGCGMMWLLAVSGVERGCIWSLDNGNTYLPYTTAARPPYPAGADWRERERVNDEFDAARLGPERRGRVKFWAWYGRWLASALREAGVRGSP